jgi:hypothetical protein
MADGGRGNAAEKSRVPDALGNDGRAQVVYSLLRNLQHQQFGLEAEAKAQNVQDDQPAPSAPNRTVAEQRSFLKSAIDKLADEYADVLPDVERLIAASDPTRR